MLIRATAARCCSLALPGRDNRWMRRRSARWQARLDRSFSSAGRQRSRPPGSGRSCSTFASWFNFRVPSVAARRAAPSAFSRCCPDGARVLSDGSGSTIEAGLIRDVSLTTRVRIAARARCSCSDSSILRVPAVSESSSRMCSKTIERCSKSFEGRNFRADKRPRTASAVSS